MHSMFEMDSSRPEYAEKNVFIPETPEKGYGDNNTPEIDMPRPSSATNVIPDEVPRRDGPGGN